MHRLSGELKEFEADLAEFADVALVAPINVQLARSGELRQVAQQMLNRTRAVIRSIDETD